MKKRTVSVFTLLGAAFVFRSSEITLCAEYAKTIVVGVYHNPPKILISSLGEPEGIFIDIIQAIAKRNRWNLLYRYGAWNDLLSELEQGSIDVLPDVAYSDERTQFFDFTRIPVLMSWVQVAVKPGTNYTDVKSFNGKKLAVLKGSIQEEYSKDLIAKLGLSIELISYETYDNLIAAVEKGEADGAVVSRFYSYSQNKKKLTMTPIILKTTTLHFTTKKNTNNDILVAIDGELARMLNDPQSEYYKSLSWWLHENPIYFIPRYFTILIAIAITACIVFLAIVLLLKQQVHKKTSALLQANNNLHETFLLVKKKEAALESSREKNEKYLHELLHRTRNNMSVISSLLYINAWNTKSDIVLQYAENIDAHIAIMSLVFGLVEKSEDFSSIKISDFINGFIDLVIQHNSKQKLNLFYLNTSDDKLLFDIALPLGFVLYEIIINMINSLAAFSNDQYLNLEIKYNKISRDVGSFIIARTSSGKNWESKDLFSGDRMKVVIDLLEKQLMGKAFIVNSTTVQIDFALLRYVLRV